MRPPRFRDPNIEIRICGYDYYREFRAHTAQTVEQSESVHAGHANVRDQDVRRFFADRVQQVFAALEAAGAHAGLAQGFFEHPAHRLIVVSPKIRFYPGGFRIRSVRRAG
jgi:hypothetical protein